MLKDNLFHFVHLFHLFNYLSLPLPNFIFYKLFKNKQYISIKDLMLLDIKIKIILNKLKKNIFNQLVTSVIEKLKRLIKKCFKFCLALALLENLFLRFYSLVRISMSD